MNKKQGGVSERLMQLTQLPEIGSIAKLSRLCKLADGTIRHAIELHRDPRSTTLKRIVQGTGCRYEWLLTGKGEMFGKEEGEMSEGLPVLAMASAADGQIQMVSEDDDHYRQRRKLPPRTHLVRVIGDSMMPVALNGQYVFVVPEPPDDGGLAVVEKKDGEVLFKRVHFQGKEVFCQSVNPDPKYRPVVLKKSQVRHFYKIIGILL